MLCGGCWQVPKGVDPHKFLVLAATATRLYNFIGGPDLERLFTNYQSSGPQFQEATEVARGGAWRSDICGHSAGKRLKRKLLVRSRAQRLCPLSLELGPPGRNDTDRFLDPVMPSHLR